MLPTLNTALLQADRPLSFTEVLAEAFQEFSREAARQTPQVLAALLVFLGFLVLGLIGQRILQTALGRVTMAPRIRLLIRRLFFGTVLAVGGIVFVGIVSDISIGRVITGLGLLSVGVGLALKSPLENMVSGILTILVAPFRIGDEIEVSGFAGRVETISIHDTIVHTFDGKRVAIPNVDVYLNAIVNQTAHLQRRYDVIVGIHYNDDLLKAVEVAREALFSTEGVREFPKPVVLVSELGEFSVNMILRFWSDPSMQNQFRVTSDVTANVKLAFDREGITIPFPIRTLHIPEEEPKAAGELQVRITDESTADGRDDGHDGGPRRNPSRRSPGAGG